MPFVTNACRLKALIRQAFFNPVSHAAASRPSPSGGLRPALTRPHGQVVSPPRLTAHVKFHTKRRRAYGIHDDFAKRGPSEITEGQNFAGYFTSLADTLNLTLRERGHCITRLAAVLTQIPQDHYLHIELTATLIILHMNNHDLYEKVATGDFPNTEIFNYFSNLKNIYLITLEAILELIKRDFKINNLNDQNTNQKMVNKLVYLHNRQMNYNALQSLVRKIDLASGIPN